MKNVLPLALIALVAAVASVIVARLGIPVWVMFIGWISFVAGGMNSKTALPSYVCDLLGVALGFIGALLIAGGTAVLGGDLALLVGVFVIVFAALLAQHLPFANLVICYFVGMTTFFASGLAPVASTGLLLAGGLFAGVASGLIAVTLSGFLTRAGTARNADAAATRS
jgi:hypothetical protein